jgi:integrase
LDEAFSGLWSSRGEVEAVEGWLHQSDCRKTARGDYQDEDIQGLVSQKNGAKLNHTYRIIRDLCETQKIDNFIFHDLRHCAVTNLADPGVDTETIMKIVGLPPSRCSCGIVQ